MADFHFLRPWWLAALPCGVLLVLYLFRMQANGGGWRNVVDRVLQPLVLSTGDAYTGRRWPLAAAVAAWILASLALAGPTWERVPVPAFRSDEALVVALDLSSSMDAADLPPSRLARAKLKLLSLLERRRGGQTGLVVFSAHAFTVTPLTTDTDTISALVGALSSDIMPSRGSYIEAGLEKAAELLRQANATDGRILVMTDAVPSDGAFEAAKNLASEGIEINVLAIGTEDGAPIPLREGGFLTDRAGNVVVPKLDPGALARLADAGGGRFSRLTASDADLDRLAPPQAAGNIDRSTDDDAELAEAWRDAGPVLAVLLLPLLALGFRRGIIAACCIALFLPMPQAEAQDASAAPDGGVASAEAPSWRDRWLSLWQRPDQLGEDAMAEQRPARAARLFEDPEWRAAAQYRAGQFAESAASLAGIDTADAQYNRGNALARAGKIEEAIAAYDRALELEPGHEDARFNRDLLQDLLDRNPSPQSQFSSTGNEQSEQQSPTEPSGGQPESSEEGEAGDAGQEQRQAQASSTPGQTPQDESGQGSDEETTADSQTERGVGDGERRESDGEPEDAEALQAAEAEAGAPGADDVEQWASDQAAEQWLRRIKQDPGGLLRRKFLYQYRRLGVDQDGNPVWPGDEAEPW
ncbi:MAG TPA: VWA domain-containing protein [Gammaproteobacteria bacterium]